MKKEIEEENKCCLCGRREGVDTRHDHLREAYFDRASEKFQKGTFMPRLNFVEIPHIQRGFNYICHNRTNCRKRQVKNFAQKRKLKTL